MSPVTIANVSATLPTLPSGLGRQSALDQRSRASSSVPLAGSATRGAARRGATRSRCIVVHLLDRAVAQGCAMGANMLGFLPIGDATSLTSHRPKSCVGKDNLVGEPSDCQTDNSPQRDFQLMCTTEFMYSDYGGEGVG